MPWKYVVEIVKDKQKARKQWQQIKMPADKNILYHKTQKQKEGFQRLRINKQQFK